MAGNKTAKKAQDAFLAQERQPIKIVIGDSATSSPTGIPSEGLTLRPAKRTKEEEERLAKTPSATVGAGKALRITEGAGVTAGMGGMHRR